MWKCVAGLFVMEISHLLHVLNLVPKVFPENAVSLGILSPTFFIYLIINNLRLLKLKTLVLSKWLVNYKLKNNNSCMKSEDGITPHQIQKGTWNLKPRLRFCPNIWAIFEDSFPALSSPFYHQKKGGGGVKYRALCKFCIFLFSCGIFVQLGLGTLSHIPTHKLFWLGSNINNCWEE